MHPANPVPSFLSWITTGINPPSRPCTLHTALSSRPFPLLHRCCCTSGPTGVCVNDLVQHHPSPLTPIRCCLRGPRSTGWCTRACRSTTRQNSRVLISGGWMGRLQGGRSGPAHKHGPANNGVRPGSPFLRHTPALPPPAPHPCRSSSSPALRWANAMAVVAVEQLLGVDCDEEAEKHYRWVQGDCVCGRGLR